VRLATRTSKTGGDAPIIRRSLPAARLLRSTKMVEPGFAPGFLGVLSIATGYLKSAFAVTGRSFDEPPAINV